MLAAGRSQHVAILEFVSDGEAAPFERVNPSGDGQFIAKAARRFELDANVEQRHASRLAGLEHLLPLQADGAEQVIGRMVEPLEDPRVVRHVRRIAI